MKMPVSEKRTQVYFPNKLYKRIEKKAKQEAKSSAAVIREAVERYLSAEEKEVCRQFAHIAGERRGLITTDYVLNE